MAKGPESALLPRVGESAAGDSLSNLVGRADEVDLLRNLLEEGAVVYLHGVAGIGKSALLNCLLEGMRAAGVPTFRLDCRSIEPTESGLMLALGHALELSPYPHLREVTARLEHTGAFIAFDHYEVFRLMDTWIRQRFLSTLPHGVRVIIASREPPISAWFSADLAAPVHQITLSALREQDALLLLNRRGVDEQAASRLNRIARGHPLALTLAAEAGAGARHLWLEEVAAARLLTELTHLFLDDVRDPLTRQALYAASTLRRATIPLLEAMLSGELVGKAFDQLASLPFVETARDGLVIHEAVREAIAARLQAVDPNRYREYRRAAWRVLRSDVSGAVTSELWRYTADMLYLISNPVVREAFFPSGGQPLAVEPAGPEDERAIALIAERHEPPEAARLLRAWWDVARQTFSVTRDSHGAVRAFFCLLDDSVLRSRLVDEDPIVELWRRHLREAPTPPGQLALGLRRWLDIEHGEMPCAGQAACWLDVKRTYMALRPALRRMYVVVQDTETYWPVVEALGFQPLPPTSLISRGESAEGNEYANVLLDFGPGSVDGWLATLAANELGLQGEAVLDDLSRELQIDRRAVHLTPLEFGVLQHLDARNGRAVPRPELLLNVWGTDYQEGSNVVDVVIRSLRAKLGMHAVVIETVRGVGYRLHPDWRSRFA